MPALRTRLLSTGFHPVLEWLEDRTVPASIVYNGSLTISGPINGAILVQQVADGRFQVFDNGVSHGLYNVTSNITINASNLNDTITVQLDGAASGKILPGTLTINAANGNDTINIRGNGNLNDRIGGNLIINAGYGNDQINIGTTAGKGLTVAGNTEITGDLGVDTVNVGNATNATQLRGNTLLHSVQNFNLGGGSADALLGALTVDMKLTPTGTALETSTVNVQLNANTSVGGAITVTGGVLNDVLSVSSSKTGSITFNAGEGNNALTLNSGNIAGNVTFTAGGANDSVTITGTTQIKGVPSVFDGDLTLTMGDGTNSYIINSNFTVADDVTITAGNIAASIAFGGQVGGDLSVTLGTGNNQFDFNGNTGATLGGTFQFTAKDGNNALNINLAAAQTITNVNFVFGNGNDSVTATNGGGSLILAGTADGGLGTDIYTGNGTSAGVTNVGGSFETFTA